MRKITKQTCLAFINGEAFHQNNTTTDGRTLWLHGNRIAWHGILTLPDGGKTLLGVFLTLAGWNTPTTRERLNGVLSVLGHKNVATGDRVLGIFQEKHEPWIGFHTVGGTETEKLPLESDTVVFVAHPIHGRGLNAVSLLPRGYK